LNADKIVTICQIAGVRYFIWSVYAPPDGSDELQEILAMTQNIANQIPSMKVDGLMSLCDFNARHGEIINKTEWESP